MPVQGSLKAMPVPELLMWISQFQKTGTLEVRAPSVVATIAFDGGWVIFSSTSNRESTLGRLLIRSGVITEAQHKEARQVRKTRGTAVAKALLDLKFLTEDQLVRFLRKKVEKEVFDLFNLAEGEFTFTENILPELDLLPMKVDVSKMLLRVTQDQDEKGEYDFDASGIRWEIPKDI